LAGIDRHHGRDHGGHLPIACTSAAGRDHAGRATIAFRKSNRPDGTRAAPVVLAVTSSAC
jgi:hypothetical protein